jgi:hypothetical protein
MGKVMRCLTATILLSAAIAGMGHDATAGSSTIGVTITTDRDPDDFRDPKDTKYELNGSHSFDNGLIFGGSFLYSDTAFSSRASQNLEGTIGYRMPLTSAFSVTGSVGVGEHWRENPSTAFPYYVLRIAAGVDLNERIAWDIVSYRFRDAFDPNDNYNTPQVATGFTYKLDADNSISAKIMRNWKEGEPSSTGISLGYKKKF